MLSRARIPNWRQAARGMCNWTTLLDETQTRVVEVSLSLIRERARLKAAQVRSKGGSIATTCLIGIPLDHNSSFLQGPAFAPSKIRKALRCGSMKLIIEEGKMLTDAGDIPVQELRNCGVNDEALMLTITDSVKLVMEEQPLRPLVVGGDHSISYPTVRAITKSLGGPVDILHLDAHPNLYDAFEDKPYSHASPFARIMDGGSAHRLVQVGLRSITQHQREQAKRFGVEQFEMRHYSHDRPILESLELGEGVKGVYVSIDVSCLDPAFAPGVSHYEPGGFSFCEVLGILQNLQGDIVGGDVVEYNPKRDTHDGMTAMVAAKLVLELCAKISK